ncbi:hypothetical protein [Streptomyces liangshanensis]|uniref:hypothetical protein n=1 Tax=Streptomyces liangshanensis TaxID=2717324 RepID=UPI0036D88755
MGRKLAGLFGIIAATLAFGFGTVTQAAHSQGPRSTQQVVADDKGPTIVPADDKGPTAVLADDKGPTVIVRTFDDKGPTSAAL